ncbi:hypothetical protein LOTGIDRAFT_189789 [Lottia gigantea]|uniref:Serine palmitoyltransferase small subunit B n=1 Tax=Lottia gigantea TaxID=225164 RepID=V4AEM8_LOTGI|nr:hypothetical protein LOTGIDRAFT_189789 [Lottia gigantea]ESO93600.1 hypothetical protein LOTGIDRAFT_189789 [Lottia gigantea]
MVFKRMWNFISFWYFQYTLVTSLYMLEPLERRVFNAILVAVLSMFFYTAYLFLPGHALMMYNFARYLMGHVNSTHEEM